MEDRAIDTPDREEQLITRAAWLSYVAGMTQAQIAKRLGLNRVRVNRMLAQARDQGIVQIRINSKLTDCVALEEQLRDRFGLSGATVVPTPSDKALVRQAIAVGAGAVLSEAIQDGMSIGMGWGRTLRLSLRSVAIRPIHNLSVVSLLGGLTRGSALNMFETASRLADLYNAECYYVAAPVFTDTEEMRDILLKQSVLEDAFDHARKVDVAFVSAGALGPDATMVQLGLIGPGELESLRAAGAVGDLCAHWIDAAGRLVDHPLNRRVIALSPEDLRPIPKVILASGGPDKVPAIRAALTLGIVDTIVTDERSATAVLASPAS
jgi:DNA-binding transcriptional regulator LsrR (DeoR family)